VIKTIIDYIKKKPPLGRWQSEVVLDFPVVMSAGDIV